MLQADFFYFEDVDISLDGFNSFPYLLSGLECMSCFSADEISAALKVDVIQMHHDQNANFRPEYAFQEMT